MLKGAATGLVAACVALLLPLSQRATAQVYCAGGDAQIRCNGSECYCPNRGGNRRAPAQPTGPSPEEIARQQRIAASREYNDQGVAAYSRGDWAEAVRLQQLALDNDPGDAVIADNLSKARARLQEQNDSKVASAKIRALMEGYSATVTPINSSGGLDFDQGPTTPQHGVNEEVKASQSLNFGDPMVVDARNVPSGLSKNLEAEIPSTPAGDRVRKGFQAIAGHDWELAVAWFGDALNHDPRNAGIARLRELARFTYEREKNTSKLATQSRSAHIDATGLAQVNAVIDQQMSEDESRTVANHDDSPEDATVNAVIDQQRESDEINALIDRGMNEELARHFAEYDLSHAPLPANAISRSSGWGAFFDALFKTPRRTLRPLSVAGIRG